LILGTLPDIAWTTQSGRAPTLRWPIDCAGQSTALANRLRWPIDCAGQSTALANRLRWLTPLTKYQLLVTYGA
jgi:hypothetical protein